jgi:hypothetical protein
MPGSSCGKLLMDSMALWMRSVASEFPMASTLIFTGTSGMGASPSS